MDATLHLAVVATPPRASWELIDEVELNTWLCRVT